VDRKDQREYGNKTGSYNNGLDSNNSFSRRSKADPKFPLEGIDIMPIISGKKKELDRTLYWRIFQRNQHKAMRDGKWKYFQDEKGNEYLFDLLNDPGELNNLKDQQQAVFKNLKMKYSEWEKTVLTPIPLGK